MPYKERHVIFSDGHIEIKRYYAPNPYVGKRASKQKPTRKAVDKNNRNNSSEKLSWLLAENFKTDDWHLSPTFATNPDSEDEAKKIFQEKFLKQLRKLYQKHDVECKYIWTIGVSSRGRIHIHLILNHIDGIEYHDLKKIWKFGQLRLNNTLYESGWYKSLALYLIDQAKLPPKTSEGAKNAKKYNCSRNLKLPEVRTFDIKKKYWRKVQPAIPAEYARRYRIDIDSVENIISDYDGQPIQRFILIKKE